MARYRKTAGFLMVACLSSVDAFGATVAGATAGTFSVNNAGAATFHVPFQLPPGVAGLRPQLALQYDSQAARGIAGPGWSLEGVQAVRRCPKTVSQDGVRGSIGLNSGDRFCLGSQRLVLDDATTKAYGSDGATYRTEIESFTRVTSIGTQGGGPSSFVVENKDGLQLTFGQSDDSKLIPGPATVGESQPTVVLTWYLSEIKDRLGNKVSYTYTNANGELLLDTVSYAGGKAKVKFSYRIDPNPRTFFIAGTKIQYTKLLESVSTYIVRESVAGSQPGGPGIGPSPSSLVRPGVVALGVRQPLPAPATTDVIVKNYRLDYDATDIKNNSEPILRLRSITECSSNEVNSAKCLPPTTFDWQFWAVGDASFQPAKKVGSVAPGTALAFGSDTFGREGLGHFRRLVDLDGDGILDFMAFWNDGAYAFLSGGSASFSSTPKRVISDFSYEGHGWLNSYMGETPIYVMPMQADQSISIVGFVNWFQGVPLDRGVFVSNWNKTTEAFDAKVKVLGSGLLAGADIEDCTFPAGSSPVDRSLPRFMVDMNADGYLDVIRFNGDAAYLSYWDPSVSKFKPPVAVSTRDLGQRCNQNVFWTPTDRPVFMEDMNGDGYPDFVGVSADDAYVAMWNPALGQFDLKVKQSSNIRGVNTPKDHRDVLRPIFLVDMNGDGYPDLVQIDADGVYVSLWTGVSFLPKVKWNLPTVNGAEYLIDNDWRNAQDWNPRFMVDMNGDGFPDLVGFGRQGFVVALSNGNGAFATPSVWSADFHNDTVDSSGNKYVQAMWTPRYLADVDGDGSPDIVGFGDKSMAWATTGKAPGARIIKITDGLGATTDITYGVTQPHNSRLYVKPSTPSVLPLHDAPGAVYAVSSVKRSNGLGQQRESTYRYGERRVDHVRGPLGFKWLEVTDKATQITTRQEFWQEYPLIGQQKAVSSQRSGVILSQLDLAWDKIQMPSAGEYAVDASGNAIPRYFPYVRQSIETRNDLNGVPLGVKTTLNSYIDPATNSVPQPFWGNLTKREVSDAEGNKEVSLFSYEPTVVSSWTMGRVSTSSISSTRPGRTVTPANPSGAALQVAPPALPPSVPTGADVLLIINTILLDN